MTGGVYLLYVDQCEAILIMLIFTQYALQQVFRKYKVLIEFLQGGNPPTTDIGRGLYSTYILCSSGPFSSCEEMAVLIPHGQVTNLNDGSYSIHMLSIYTQCQVKKYKYSV